MAVPYLFDDGFACAHGYYLRVVTLNTQRSMNMDLYIVCLLNWISFLSNLQPQVGHDFPFQLHVRNKQRI